MKGRKLYWVVPFSFYERGENALQSLKRDEKRRIEKSRGAARYGKETPRPNLKKKGLHTQRGKDVDVREATNEGG